MEPDLTWIIMGRLLLAAVLSGVVGLERELSKKPAGLRTNIFIGVGAALFTILSAELARKYGGDPARIAAQIIPGIGFIGAGAILRERGEVVGLTTAATIFVVASVGMAVGSGMYLTAVFASLLAVAVLVVLGWVEERFSPKTRNLTFRMSGRSLDEMMPKLQESLERLHIAMRKMKVAKEGQEQQVEFQAQVSHEDQKRLLESLQTLPGRCEIVGLDEPSKP